MDSFQLPENGHSFSVLPPPITAPPSHQYFGGNDQDTSPMMDNFSVGQFFQDDPDHGVAADESNDAKRRRIARVETSVRLCKESAHAHVTGLRYVSEEEDKV